MEIKKTRNLANVRIHVEQIIGLLQQKYLILQSTLPTDIYMCNTSKDGNQDDHDSLTE